FDLLLDVDAADARRAAAQRIVESVRKLLAGPLRLAGDDELDRGTAIVELLGAHLERLVGPARDLDAQDSPDVSLDRWIGREEPEGEAADELTARLRNDRCRLRADAREE